MTAYLDLTSIAPTEELAEARLKMLGLAGVAVGGEERYVVLFKAGEGDKVYCGVAALDYWRKLDARVRLFSVDHLGAQDAASARTPTWIEWALRQSGADHSTARRLAKRPPLSEKHGAWELYQRAFELADALETAQPMRPLPTRWIGEAPVAREQPYRWTLVDNPEALALAQELLSKACAGWLPGVDRIGIDVETDVAGDAPNEMQDTLWGIGVSIGKECFYGEFRYGPWTALLHTYLPDLPWVGHHAKYDYCVLRRHGITPGPIAGDGRLAAYLLGEPFAGLKPLTLTYLGHQMITYDEVVGTGRDRVSISQVDPRLTAEYCCGDCYFGVEIEALLCARLPDKARQMYYEVELPLIEVLWDMQAAGVPFDRRGAARRLGETWREQKQLAHVVNELALSDGFKRPDRTWVCKGCRNGKNKKINCPRCAGVGRFSAPEPINLNAPQQLAAWLHDTMGLRVQALTDTRQPSMDALSLLQMKGLHAAISLVLRWKRLDKERGYLIKWLKGSKADGKLHTNYNNARVASGRLSSEEPNLQQVALRWREHFVAGVLAA